MRKMLGTRVLEWWLREHQDDRVALAKILHIDKSTLSRALSGERGIGDDVITAIVVHLPEYAQRPGAFFPVARAEESDHNPEATPMGETRCANATPEPSSSSTTPTSTAPARPAAPRR